MIVNFVTQFFGKRKKSAFVLALAAGLCGTVAAAQEASQAAGQAAPQAADSKNANPPPAEAPPAPVNPFRAVTDFMGITTESGQAADFVRQTRPGGEMDYSHLTGVDKPRVPVKTPAEVEADKAALVAEREKADVRRKKLQDEKLAPVAPNKAPPAADEHF